MLPEIDVSKCNGCGLCLVVCHGTALVMANGIAAIVDSGECDWCTYCEAVCPTGAISCRFQIVVEDSSDNPQRGT